MKGKKRLSITIHTYIVGSMAVNCHVVVDDASGESLIIDAGDDSAFIAEKILALGVKPKAIVATHGHFDHIMGAFALQQTYSVPFIMHESDQFLLSRMAESAQYFLGTRAVDPPPMLTRVFRGGETITVGDENVEIIHTPGHTPGSICLHHARSVSLLSGDLLFSGGGVGRTDFSYSDPLKLRASIGQILKLSDNTTLYPGHGEKTTLAHERQFQVGSREHI